MPETSVISAEQRLCQEKGKKSEKIRKSKREIRRKE